MVKRLGIIGGGVMAEAILARLLAQGVYAADEIGVGEMIPDRCAFLRDRYGVTASPDNRAVLAATEAILLAVKPQGFDRVTADLRSHLPAAGPVWISILAGVALGRLEAALPGQAIVRTMPNTPALAGAGITAFTLGTHCRPEDRPLVTRILGAVGETQEVPESLMDAVTGLSGSGPAFVSLFVEALADGGVAAGLPRPLAQRLALQTVLGTAQLLHQEDLHPALLKDRVTSPGGTTIAGVRRLENLGLRGAVMEAVIAAAERSQALGQG